MNKMFITLEVIKLIDINLISIVFINCKNLLFINNIIHVNY